MTHRSETTRLREDIHEVVAAHTADIETLREGQENLRVELRSGFADVRQDIKSIAVANNARGRTNWNLILGLAGLGVPVIGALFFIIYREMDHAGEIQSIRHGYLERDVIHANAQIDEVDSRITVAEQQIKSNGEKSEWRKDALDSRIDELQRWIAQEYRIRSGVDMPRAEPVNRGPNKSSDNIDHVVK